MFVHLPGRFSRPRDRNHISHLDTPIHSFLLFAELAGVTSTCEALRWVSGGSQLVPNCIGFIGMQSSNVLLSLLLSAGLKI